VPIAEGQTAETLAGTTQGNAGAKVGQPSQSASNAEGRPIANAVRIDQLLRLDLTVDDPLWQQAAPIADFKQKSGGKLSRSS
jgi:hypothetical protein